MESKENSLVPLIVFGVPAGIGIAYLLERLERRSEKITAQEFARSYLEKKSLAAGGDAQAQAFVDAAKRRLRSIRDKAILGEDEPKRFIESLREIGITESDYLK